MSNTNIFKFCSTRQEKEKEQEIFVHYVLSNQPQCYNMMQTQTPRLDNYNIIARFRMFMYAQRL